MDRLFAFLIAMIITMALIPPFMRLASYLGVVDTPWRAQSAFRTHSTHRRRCYVPRLSRAATAVAAD